MEKEKRCIELVEKNYQDRLNEIEQALEKDLNEEEGLFQMGLSFDYVPPNTFEDQDEPYYRWQLSWGGPSDEFRIYTDDDCNIQRIEYWYMDWFDGASVDCTHNKTIRNAVSWYLEYFGTEY